MEKLQVFYYETVVLFTILVAVKLVKIISILKL